MKEALDLRPLGEALDALAFAVSGGSAVEVLEEAAELVRGRWRDNIVQEGLVDTGTYLDSIEVEILHDDDRGAWVSIGTSAADEKGIPYPVVLEYGTATMPARPVGMRSFDTSRRRVVQTVSAGLAHKLKSRQRKARKKSA